MDEVLGLDSFLPERQIPMSVIMSEMNGSAQMEPQVETVGPIVSEVVDHALQQDPPPQPDIESVVKGSKEATEKKAAAKQTPEEKFLAELCGLQEKAQDEKAEYLAAKQEASELKKQWDALAQEVLDRLKAWAKPVPLFDHKPAAETEVETKTSDGCASNSPTAGDLSNDESWRQVKIEDLRMPHKDDPAREGKPLPPTILQKLNDADLTTLGMLADWTTQKTLTDIPGIGEGPAEKIMSATDLYWARRKAEADAAPTSSEPKPVAEAPEPVTPEPVTTEPQEEPKGDAVTPSSDGSAEAAAPYCVNCSKRFPVSESDSRWKLGFLFPLGMERISVRKKFPIKDQSGHICGTCHFDFVEKDMKADCVESVDNG